MSDDTAPEADRVTGAPHPRETEVLYGQAIAEQDFLTAVNSHRLHHGWLITGPIGVGKATLAWRIARFLLATPLDDGAGLFGDPVPHTSLDVSPDHPVAHRLLARSEPGLFSITRSMNAKTGKLRDQIVVDDVRGLAHFLTMSSADGGRRVVIVDSADEMNVNAANALLKMLEEPPERTTMLLISHQPSRLLPTIRSRCRELRLHPLSPEDMHNALMQAGFEAAESPALAELAAGSVGEALRILQSDGLALYAELISLFATEQGFDRQRAIALSNAAVGPANAERYELLLTLIDLFLIRLARTGALGQSPATEVAPNEAQVLSRLAPNAYKARAWAAAAQEISDRTHHGKAVNLDPAALVLDTVFKIHQTATA